MWRGERSSGMLGGAVLLGLLCVSACKGRPGGPGDTMAATGVAREAVNAVAPEDAAGQPYDFYILNLSWSPEYCHSHAGAAECREHLGFVVHGLWPQRNDGSYPKDCGSRQGPTSEADWQGLFPTQELAQHEWETHGVCTPYSADTYFGLVRKARSEVEIPAEFSGASQPRNDTPEDIVAQFSRINTGFPANGIALSCGNNWLTAMQFCLDKNLNPIACVNVRSCRANSVKIASAGGGDQ